MAVSTFLRIVQNSIYVISLLLFNICKSFKKLNLHYKYRGIQKSENNYDVINLSYPNQHKSKMADPNFQHNSLPSLYITHYSVFWSLATYSNIQQGPLMLFHNCYWVHTCIHWLICIKTKCVPPLQEIQENLISVISPVFINILKVFKKLYSHQTYRQIKKCKISQCDEFIIS